MSNMLGKSGTFLPSVEYIRLYSAPSATSFAEDAKGWRQIYVLPAHAFGRRGQNQLGVQDDGEVKIPKCSAHVKDADGRLCSHMERKIVHL